MNISALPLPELRLDLVFGRPPYYTVLANEMVENTLCHLGAKLLIAAPRFPRLFSLSAMATGNIQDSYCLISLRPSVNIYYKE